MALLRVIVMMIAATLAACGNDSESWPGYLAHQPLPEEESASGSHPQFDCPHPPPVVLFRDTCEGSGTINFLLGTCWQERCFNGEKTLFPKPAGVNCVYKPLDAPNDEFFVGQCDENGVCGGTSVDPPK